MSMQPDGLRLPTEAEEFVETAKPVKTLQEAIGATSGATGEGLDVAGFATFSPLTGAPTGDAATRNQYIRDLMEAGKAEGWNIVGESSYPTTQERSTLSFAYAASGAAMPILTRPAKDRPGFVEVVYSDGSTGTMSDTYAGGGGFGGGGFGGGGGIVGSTMSNAGSPAMRAARDSARLLAEQYGLGGDFFSQIEQFLYEDISEASLIMALRNTNAYKKRFAANATRVAKGLPALSESEYLRMESLYRQELRAAGLPPEFYDSLDDFKTYIENDLSYNEFVGRVGLAKRASQMASPEVKRQLKDLYGVGDSDLVGYFLNPQKATTVLQRQFNVAQTAGALSTAGFGTTMAEELTTAVVGGRPETTLDYGELTAATQTAAAARPLAMEVLGGEGGAVTEQDLLRGIVAEDVQGQRRLQREQQRRLAEYQAGGALAESQQGVIGLRSAAR